MRLRERQARRGLLIGLGVYAVLQVGLVWLLAVKLPGLRTPSYTDRTNGLKNRMKEPAAPPLSVVMFGSSRTVNGVKAALLDEPLSAAAGRPVVAYNFGFWGAGSFSHLLNLRRLLADGLRPDLVLIEVLPALLDEKSPILDLNEEHLPIQRLHRGELGLLRRYAGGQRHVSSRDWWLGWTQPGYSHRFALVSAVSPSLLRSGDRQDEFRTVDKGGWIPAPAVLSSERRAAALDKARRDFAHQLQTMKAGGRPVKLLDEMLGLCRKEGIPAALVLMPEGPVYRSWYAPAVWQQIRGVLGQLEQRHGVRLIDARCWVDSEEAFLDSHHLLPAAAASFSRRLGEEAAAVIRHERSNSSHAKRPEGKP